MSTRTDYGELATKLDYAALDKRFSQLADRQPPRKRKTAADLLEPLRETLLTLHRKGWSSAQLVEELKNAGVPVSPARFRDCLSRWKGGGAKSRANRAPKAGAPNHRNTMPPPQTVRSRNVAGDNQAAPKLTQR
jgi:hypothetical protein